MSSWKRGVALIWLLLPAVVLSVSLSEFQPAASNLTPACAAVYLRSIPGCQASDFPSCSSACIKGMIAINEQVYRSCSGSTQDNQFLIGVFLQGNGIHTLCQNVAVATSVPTSSPPPRLPSTSSLAPVATSSATCLVVDTRSPPSMSHTAGMLYTKSKSHTHTQRTSAHSSIAKTSAFSSTTTSQERVKPTGPSTSSTKVVGQFHEAQQSSSTTTSPTTTSTNTCTDDGSPFGGQCSSGSTITLHTTHFVLVLTFIALATIL